MSQKQNQYQLTDHVCRNCGGRVLMGQRMGAGGAVCGEPYICADCETSVFGDVSNLCWCGFTQRGQEANAFACARLDRVAKEPWLKNAFGHAGTDPDSQTIKVGVLSRAHLEKGDA